MTTKGPACLLSIWCLILILAACSTNSLAPESTQPLDWSDMSGQLNGDVYAIPDGFAVCGGLLYRENTFYSFEQGTLAALPTAFFTSHVECAGEDIALSFAWCQYDGRIYLAEEQASNVRCSIEPIPGCTTAVMCKLFNRDSLDYGSYALCDLETDSMELLFPDIISAHHIRQLEISSDLTKAAFVTHEGGYCFDGEQVIDLAVLCSVEKEETFLFGTRWLGDELLFTVTDCTIHLAPRVDCFLYHCEDGKWEQTMADIPQYVQGYQDNGLMIHGNYATLVTAGTLCVLDLRTGRQYDTELNADGLYSIAEIGGGLIVTVGKDGQVTLLNDGMIIKQENVGLTPDLGVGCFSANGLLTIEFMLADDVVFYQIPTS